METVEVGLMVPKESKDVIDLVVAIIQQVKDGVQAEDVLAIVDELAEAFAGIQAVPEEVKSEYLGDLIAFAGKSVVDALIKKG